MESSNSDTERPAVTWLVVTNAAGKFICRTTHTPAEVLDLMQTQRTLLCAEAYDFSCPMQAERVPNGSIQLSKAQFASRLDATCYLVPVHLSLAGAMLYFLNDLKEADAEMYKSIILQAHSAAENAARGRARQTSGIVTGVSMPKEPFGRGKT